MRRRVLVEISRGGSLHAMLKDEQPKSLMKLIFLGINVPDVRVRRMPDNVEKEKILIALDTDRFLDRWLMDQWLQWCSSNRKEMRLNAWLTMQIHKGWEVVVGDKAAAHVARHDTVLRDDRVLHDEKDRDDDYFDFMIPDDDEVFHQEIVANVPTAHHEHQTVSQELNHQSPSLPVKEKTHLGAKPEYKHLRNFFSKA